jgi:hypothetical protein
VSVGHIILTLLLCVVPDHPSWFSCPDILSLVGDPLLGNRCGLPKHVVFVSFLLDVLFTEFIFDE